MNRRPGLFHPRCWLSFLLIMVCSASRCPAQGPVDGSASDRGDSKAKSAGSAPEAATDDSIKPLVATVDIIEIMATSPLAARPEFTPTGSELGNNILTTGAGDLIDLGEGKVAEGLSKMSRAASVFNNIGEVPVSEGSAALGSIAGKDTVGTVVNVAKVGVVIGIGMAGKAAILAYGSWAVIPVALGGLAVGAIAKALLDYGGAGVDAYLSQMPTAMERKKRKLQDSINRCENDFKNGWISEAQRNKWVETQKASIKQLDDLKKEVDDFRVGVLAPIEASLKAIKDAAEKDIARLKALEDQLALSRSNEETAPDADLQQVARNVTRKRLIEIANVKGEIEDNDSERSKKWKTIEPNLKEALAKFQILKNHLNKAIYRSMGIYYLGYKLEITGPAACNEGDDVTLTLTLCDPPEPGINLPPYDFECRVDDDSRWNLLKDGVGESGVRIKREGKRLTIGMTAGSSDITFHFQVIEKAQAASGPKIEAQTVDVSARTRLVYAQNSITIRCKPKDKTNVVQPLPPRPSTPPSQPQVLIDYLNAKKAYDQARKQVPPPSNIREISDDYQKKYKAYIDWVQK